MKKIVISIISLLIFFTLFSINAYADGTDPQENNDTPYTATSITLPYTTTFKIDTPTDEDWFKFTLDKEGALRTKTEGVSTNLFIDYDLYKEGDAITSVISLSNEVANNFQYNYKLKSGTYYIRIKGHNNKFSSAELKLTIDQLPEDEMENNDTWESAYAFPLGQEKTMTLNAPNDTDWFKVTLDKEGALALKVNGDDYSLGIKYELYTQGDLKTPIYIYNNMHEYGYKRNLKVKPGIYYIKLCGNSEIIGSHDFSDKEFKLTISQLPEDKMENNDIWESAYLFPLGQEESFSLNAVNDVDWFKITVEKEGTIALKIDGEYSRLGIEYEMYKEGNLETPIYKFNDMFEFDYQRNFKVAQGTYYIKLAGSSQHILAEKFDDREFKLTIKQLPEDEMENNDTWESAYLFPLGQEKIFTIDAVNDIDWYKFSLSTDDVLRLGIVGEKAGVYSYLYINYSLYKEGNLTTPIYSFENIKTENYQNNIKLKPGNYYICIKGDDENYSELETKLSISQLPGDDLEPNDTYDLAYAFPLGQLRSISINYPDDIDWFKVTLDKPLILRCRLENTSSEGVNLLYKIYKSDNITATNPLAEYSTSFTLSSNTNKIISYTLQQGTYYISLTGQNKAYKDEEFWICFYTDDYNVVRPEVKSITPYGNSGNVDVNKNVEIIFNKAIDINTLTHENIFLKLWNDPVDFDIDYIDAENKLVIIPKENLNYGSTYNVELSHNLKAQDNGFMMLKDYRNTFTTREKRIDDTPVGNLMGQVKISDSLKGLVGSATVHLKGNNFSISANVDNYGKFLFENVPEGTYEISAELPGFVCKSKTVVIEAYKDVTIELEPVFGDLNGDGIVNIFDFVIMSKSFNQGNN